MHGMEKLKRLLGHMRFPARPPAIMVLPAATTGQTPTDVVTLNNFPGCMESRLIAWGKFQPPPATPPVSPATFAGECDQVPVGNVDRDTTHANQVVAFTVGRPPAIDSDVQWWTGNPHAILFPGVFQIKVKVWVVTSDPTLNFSTL